MSQLAISTIRAPLWPANPAALALALTCIILGSTGCNKDTSVTTNKNSTQDEASCDSCHGMPPGAPHVTNTACGSCHGMVVDNLLRIIDESRHNNGVVDVDMSNLACLGCHGTALSMAPPVDTRGETRTTFLTVGAHQAHLGASNWHREVACSDCHLVPANVDDPGHIDPAPAEIVWSAVSRANGVTPSLDRQNETCMTYCHGPSLIPGGTITEPSWTLVDGSQAACGTCHGMPPQAPHPASSPSQCSNCHGSVVDSNLVFVAPSLHINGIVEVSNQACNVCHGNADNSAPPIDTQGETGTTFLTVGAHQAHLGASNWHREVACADCHLVPSNVDDPGHIDPAPAEIVWSALSRADGVAPGLDRQNETCMTYCHGPSLIPGGTITEPSWTLVDGSQAACGTCHGMPPQAPHPPGNDCGSCHGSVHDGNNFVAPQLHIDGIVQVNGGDCGSCHGNPPTPGNESYPGSGGAHLAHVVDAGMTCGTCHGNDGTGPSHNQGNGTVIVGNVDIVFDSSVAYPGGTTMNNGQAASAGSPGGNLSCFVGCHNPIPGDDVDLANSVRWTEGTLGCDGCHERPGTTAPFNHSIDGNPATIRANCQVCHNTSTHLSGLMLFNDPDPTDTFSYASGGVEELCQTCHDGGAGTFFGGDTPSDQSGFWQLPSSHFSAGQSCQTCHGYHGARGSPDLVASREEDLCNSCHDGSSANYDILAEFEKPSHHPVVDSEQGRFELECVSCHNPHEDTAGISFLVDPDPTDSIVPAGFDSLYCLTCHDGGQAEDKTPALAGSHLTAGVGCMTDCHVDGAGVRGASQAPWGPHGSTNPGLGSFSEEAMCEGCHDEVREMSNAGTFSHHHVVDAEQVTAGALECDTCHESHLIQSSPRRFLTDPDTLTLLPASDVPYDYSDDRTAAARDNGKFCLDCHDGSWPGAANIAAELANDNTRNSAFWADGKNQHRKHRNWPNGRSGEVACNYCHDAHGSTGTSGIRRGALLSSWITVNQFPYRKKNSCGTADSRCH